MRTTLILPEELIDAARKTLGFTSKTDTVVYALREMSSASAARPSGLRRVVPLSFAYHTQ
jgi:hypothetical protein